MSLETGSARDQDSHAPARSKPRRHSERFHMALIPDCSGKKTADWDTGQRKTSGLKHREDRMEQRGGAREPGGLGAGDPAWGPGGHGEDAAEPPPPGFLN